MLLSGLILKLQGIMSESGDIPIDYLRVCGRLDTGRDFELFEDVDVWFTEEEGENLVVLG